ncbi:class I SAM-dependent methyltransferase [Halorientalis marina]|uniref:class I SAM-dependent methyltransferase n=1 Tax=Halorientalis marina TaxID=2931976 RepID=UPI001FF164FD|nr:class I SAM-dependent methyltransferase [Halorientalis marina]
MSDVESFIRFCESEFGTAVMNREAAYVKQHVSADDRILDVGCGIGSLEERFPDHEMIGVDRSEAMIQAAQDRVSAPFVLGDATALPIATASVDAVVSVSTLEFIPDIDAVLAEATRVLAPGGTPVALMLNTRSEYVQSNLRREGSYFQRMDHGTLRRWRTRYSNTLWATRSSSWVSPTSKSSRAQIHRKPLSQR